MLRHLSIIRNRLNSGLQIAYLKFKNPSARFGKNIRIYGRLLFKSCDDSTVVLGDNLVIRSATKYNFVGINKAVSIAVLKNAQLSIGDYTGFSGTSIFAAQKIVIGKYCNFGGNTAIWDTDFHPLEYSDRRVQNTSKIRSMPVIIGDDVFVGANTIILKGVEIGDRAVIGAGSVVTKNIPPDEIWAGNPAKFIRKTAKS